MSVGFRATILWNEVVRDFVSNMEKKRHRYHLMSLEDTFTGKEACNFLLTRLQENELFGPEIDKKKIKLLLSKFLYAGVFENVPKSDKDFRSKGLYRFPKQMPLKDLTSTAIPSQKKSLPQKSAENDERHLNYMILIYRYSIHVGDTLHIPIGVTCLHTNSKKDKCRKLDYADYCEKLLIILMANKDAWRNKVINRITDVMGSTADKFLRELMQRPSLWSCINACLMRRTFQRRRDSPDWVDESLKCLGFYGFRIPEKNIYDGYFLDVAKLLHGHIIELFSEKPICSDLLLTLVHLYVFLNEIDNERKTDELDLKVMELSCLKEMEAKALALLNDDDDSGSDASSMQDKMLPMKKEEDDDDDDDGILCDEDTCIEDAQEYLWRLTTPKRNVGYKKERVLEAHCKEARSLEACEPKVCLETAFSGEEPVTRIITNSGVAGSGAATSNDPEEALKHKRCTESRCFFEKSNVEHLKVQTILKKVITLAMEDQNKSADPLNEAVKLFSNICYKKKAEKWLQEVKFHAVHLYRLALLFLPPRDYYLLEMSLFLLSLFRKIENDEHEMYYDICKIIFGSSNYKCHAFRDIVDFFIVNRRELFKPFEMEQIIKEDDLSFFKDLKKIATGFSDKTTNGPMIPADFPWPNKYGKTLNLATVTKTNTTNVGTDTTTNTTNVDNGLIDKTNTTSVATDLSDTDNSASSCVRITKEMFQKQTITDSQKALENLLDQIIQSEKMTEKERKKRLKKFSEEYPHIYETRFKQTVETDSEDNQTQSKLVMRV